jgi:hypothetical protein
MPATWKKVIVSGSSAELANLNVNTQIVASGSINVANSSGVINQIISSTAAQLTGSFTGSFSGTVTGTVSATSSYSVSSSYAYTASSAVNASASLIAVSASYAYTASSAINASASLIAVSASYAYTASSAVNATSALTASSADNFVVRNSLTASNAIIQNTLTAQTLVVTTVSSSVEYSSGSNIFGNSTANTQTMTGSLNVSGAVNIVGPINGTNGGFTGSFSGSFYGAHTGSLFGTSSQAVSASYAYTASSAINASASLIAVSSSYAYTASSAINASASLIAISSSYAGTASYAIQTIAALSQGSGITAFSYNGSSSVAISVSGAAALSSNYLPKWTGAGFSNSNISDLSTSISVAVPTFFTSDVTVGGNITVNGTASFINTQNVLIKDKFILLASGSTSLTDAGIVIAYSGSMTGSAFYLSSNNTGPYGRWAVAYNQGDSVQSVTADEYMVTTKVSATAPSNAVAPTWGSASNGYGNMWVNTTTDDIYIWA